MPVGVPVFSSFPFSVFRFNAATQPFPPRGSAKSASSLCSRSAASVPFSTSS